MFHVCMSTVPETGLNDFLVKAQIKTTGKKCNEQETNKNTAATGREITEE